jgi:hypothetical protein
MALAATQNSKTILERMIIHRLQDPRDLFSHPPEHERIKLPSDIQRHPADPLISDACTGVARFHVVTFK